MKHTAIFLSLLLCAPLVGHAQKLVETREQATGWYVPVKVQVTAERGKAKLVNVTVYKDNQMVREFQSKNGKFTLTFDLDQAYTFVLHKEGYRSKSVYVDTHMPPEQVQYAAYECKMNLEAADKFDHSDPFFLDFPSAVVRWDGDVNGFLPSTKYVTDIQSKIGMLQAQMLPY
jgi:hypothetical protein